MEGPNSRFRGSVHPKSEMMSPLSRDAYGSRNRPTDRQSVGAGVTWHTPGTKLTVREVSAFPVGTARLSRFSARRSVDLGGALGAWRRDRAPSPHSMPPAVRIRRVKPAHLRRPRELYERHEDIIGTTRSVACCGIISLQMGARMPSPARLQEWNPSRPPSWTKRLTPARQTIRAHADARVAPDLPTTATFYRSINAAMARASSTGPPGLPKAMACSSSAPLSAEASAALSRSVSPGPITPRASTNSRPSESAVAVISCLG